MAPPPAPTAATAAGDSNPNANVGDEQPTVTDASSSSSSHERAVTALEHHLPHHHRPEQYSPATMSASFSINPNRPLVTPQNRRQPFEELGYELRETLGEGEFGKVKLAIHKATGNKVAIKVFKRARLDDAEKQNKLRREIAILLAVIHKSIVRLFEVLETDELVGLVIEYASGGELFDYILNNKYLSEDEAGRLFAQLIDGVNYLHQKCVVHRDLKLENLLLSESKNLVIIDFGFANQFPDPSTLATPAPEAPFSDPLRAQSIPDRHFLMATSCGSPCYAAPELVVADGYVGTCADVWSCGVILFAMLAGYLPFDDDPENPHGDNITLLYKYILSEPTPLHMPPHLSADAQDLLRRMLVPDPDRRATMKEVMEHKWLAAYRHFFTKDFSKPPPVPQKDPHRSKSSSRRSKSRTRPPAESFATTTHDPSSSSTQRPPTVPAMPVPQVVNAEPAASSSLAQVTTVPNSSAAIEDTMDVDVRKSPVLPVPSRDQDDMQVDPAIAALLAPPTSAAVASAVEPSTATAQSSSDSATVHAVTASTGAANRRMSVDNSQLATAAVSFPALSGNDTMTAGETTTSTKKSANSYKRNTFSGPSSTSASGTKSSSKHGGGFLDDLKHSIAKLKWRTSRSSKRGAGSTTSSTHASSPAAPEPVHIQIVPATATPSEASSPPVHSPIVPPAPLLAPPAPLQPPSATAVSRALATSPPPPPPPTPPKHPRTPSNHASVLATLTRGRAANQDVVFTRTDISQDTVHQVFDPATQVAGPSATPATGSRQRSKSVGGRSMVASIRSLVDGGASTAVYERTDVPPVPDLPESLPAAPVGPYQSVYSANGTAQGQDERGRSATKDASVTVKRGRSLTDKLLGRNKRPAEVPPPLPTGFFNTLTPAMVSVDDARQFPAEALTTRTPEVALFEVRKVLEGLGAVVVGHGTDPVRGIPGHGDGPFLLKCRLKLGKKGSGVTPARLKAELDALSLLENDEDYAPVALPSVDSDSGSRPPGAHRRRKSTATSGGTSTSDALSVYSGYSVVTSGGSTPGAGSAQVLPEDYPPLYTQPDVAAAIAAGRTGPVLRSVTPVIPAGTLQSATGAATTSNATAVAYEQTMLASSANAAEASNSMYLNKSVSVHYSSYYSSTPTMSGNARAINEGVHVGSVAKGQVPADNKGAMQVIKRGLMSFGTDLLFTVEIVGLPEHKSTWAIKFHRTKGSSVSYGRVKQIVLRKLYRSDDKLRQLLG